MIIQNHVTAYGKPKSIQRLKKLIEKNQNRVFDAIFPLKKRDDPNEFWGCGNESPFFVSSFSKKEAVFDFDTLWTPPIGVFQKLQKRYKSLEIRLYHIDKFSEMAGIFTKTGNSKYKSGSRGYEKIENIFKTIKEPEDIFLNKLPLTFD
jgi:hypothetical protein